jgi:hypothetical protein
MEERIKSMHFTNGRIMPVNDSRDRLSSHRGAKVREGVKRPGLNVLTRSFLDSFIG